MLAAINQQVFDSLDDAALIWTCIEPTIQKIRGRNSAVKGDAYTELSEGQRALLMFQVMYGHTSTGIVEFYSLVPYLPSGRGIWIELKKGMQYFSDNSMLRLLGEMEGDYCALEEKILASGTERLDVCINNPDKDSHLMSSIKQHNLMFRETIPNTIKLISSYIRNNPSEFVQLEN